jgi:hypothetical protein
MHELRCSNCGQRYYGFLSRDAHCCYCQQPLEESGWSTIAMRATMMPLPVVEAPPLPTSQSTNRSGIGSPAAEP